MAASTPRTAPAAKRDRTHYLYIAVIIAVALGIAVGLIAPDFAVELKPIGTGFVNLIKMMISPIIFCTIVLGIGSVRKAAKVGAVGGIALGYFLVMSLVALGIGLVVGNILDPGSSLAVTDAVKEVGQAQVDAEAKDTTEFLLLQSETENGTRGFAATLRKNNGEQYRIQLPGTTDLPLNQWTHVVVTLGPSPSGGGTTGKIYFNGVLMNGGTRDSDGRDRANPCTAATSRACSELRGGNRPGSRCASMLLPTPGQPLSSKPCPPAAASSRATRAAACPWTSDRHGTGASSRGSS